MPRLILDKADCLDWVRVHSIMRYKSKDTALVPRSLLKFSLEDVPAGITLQNAFLNFFVEKSYTPGGLVQVFAIRKDLADDNWNFYDTLSRDLYHWLVPLLNPIGQYPSDETGWKNIEIPRDILTEGLQKGTLSFKFQEEAAGNPLSRIASPLSFDTALAPYIEIDYTGSDTLPDLAIYRFDIQFSTFWPTPGDIITLTATIHNNGTTGTSGLEVRFYDGSPFDGGTLIGTVYTGDIPGGGGTAQVSIDWPTPDTEGRHNIYVWVDPQGLIPELHKTNNLAFRTLYIRNDYTLYQNSFEGTDHEWILDVDNLIIVADAVGEGPHIAQHPMLVGGHPSCEDAHTGTYCMRLVFDATHDDGTIWIVRPVPLVIPKGGSKTMRVDFYVRRSAPQVFQVIAAIDTSIPEIEQDFTVIGDSLETWQLYTYQRTFNAGPVPFNKEIFVAVGINITQTAAIDTIHYLDDITIQIS